MNSVLRWISKALLFACTAGMCVFLTVIPAAGASRPEVTLEQAFRLMYGLKFQEAGNTVCAWSELNPRDPLGPVSEAAVLLFSELDRLGVLESRLFVNDSNFESRGRLRPDPGVRARFLAALARGEEEAQAGLSKNPEDRDALFAMTLVHGLRADYAGLIEKENMASLRQTKEAAKWAGELLALDPGYYDAYLATGISQYIVGSLFAPLRWLLRLGGYTGDREEGIRQLRLVAEHGRLLAPFAQLLLAVAWLRNGQPERARQLLAGLRDEFPSNPLYAREIERIDSRSK